MIIITGPVIWAIYFVVSYIISGAGCALGLQQARVAGFSAVEFLLLLAALLAAALIGISAAWTWRGRRDALNQQSLARSDNNHSEQRESQPGVVGLPTYKQRAFSFTLALGLSAFSLVGVLWLAMNAILSHTC